MKPTILLRILHLVKNPINLALCLIIVISIVPSQQAVYAEGAVPNGNGTQSLTQTSLWVDAVSGKDSNDGSSPTRAFRTIQKAADIASPGTVIHILPGVYREAVEPATSGNSTQPIVYIAENGRNTVFIRGSESSASLSWSQLTGNTIGLPPGVDPSKIYYADLSTWNLSSTPRFVVELGGDGQVLDRLPLAREPDWDVTTEWKYHEYWWAADGGSDATSCDPVTNPDPDCDSGTRSYTQLTDRTNDNEPAGIEAGNLTSVGNLTGGTLVAIDTISGHYIYRRTINSHDVSSGRITVDEKCSFDGKVGLGWGSKYYIENLPALIDSPGEWWYDVTNSRLYLWPRVPGNPASQDIEISRRDVGFVLSDRSYITLNNLNIELFNDFILFQSQTCSGCGSYQNTVINSFLGYANIGIKLEQEADQLGGSVTDGFTLENSEVGYMDSRGIVLNYWWSGGTADTFTHPGIKNTLIRNNELHHLALRSDYDNAEGILVNFADSLRFEGNYVHHIAHNGVAINKSVIQSSKTQGFSPEEIKTGRILIKDNIFEKACLQNADCGEVKFWGDAPDNHVFRDVLITGNVFRNTFGWTYISDKRDHWSGGINSDVQGMGGFGLYVDNASGIHAYRNIAYNNAWSGFHLYNLWWDGDIVYSNNVSANSLNGIYLAGVSSDIRSSINTQIINNVVLNNEGYGVLIYNPSSNYGNLILDHNLYYNNGWQSYADGGLWMAGVMTIYRGNNPGLHYQTLSEIQAQTPWEDNGIEGAPLFLDYDYADHTLFDGSWPNFHLAGNNANVVDRGTITLPASLSSLLDTYRVADYHLGTSYDIGRYEAGFVIFAEPSSQAMDPGGTVLYNLSLFPPDTPNIVNLSMDNPSPKLELSLSSGSITGGQIVTLTVSETKKEILSIGEWYSIPVTGVEGDYASGVNLGLLIGGTRTYLPVIGR